jgi:hypothetical protein
LLLAGNTIETDLITAFNSGPPAAVLSSITNGLAGDMANVQAWLSLNAASAGFDSDTTASILSQSPQQLAQTQANLFAYRYQSNALTYLAPIAGTAGKALLASLANNSQSPFQSIASLAIASNLSNLRAAYEAIGAPHDKFNLQGVAELSPGHTVNPVSSDTIVHLGSFVALIPGGSFTILISNVYTFSGTVNVFGGGTANLTMAIVVINPPPKLAKQIGPTLLIGVVGSGVDLSASPAPVQAGLMFGATGGTVTATKL